MLDREENRRHARLVRKAHRLAVADLLETAAMKGVAQAAGPGQASSSQEALPHLLADEEALPQVARPVQAPPEAPPEPEPEPTPPDPPSTPALAGVAAGGGVVPLFTVHHHTPHTPHHIPTP
jgi:hypothetical protein